MERRQFINLLENKGTADKEMIPLLQDFISRFPYCQTGHLLLTRCLHDQQNILFDQQLKTSAVYAADRKILFKLIHPADVSSAEYEAPVFRETPVFPFVPSVFGEEKKSDDENIFIETPLASNPFSESFSEPAINDSDSETGSVDSSLDELLELKLETEFHHAWQDENTIAAEPAEEKNLDPHDVIRKRLNEILGANSSSDSKTTTLKAGAQKEEAVANEDVTANHESKLPDVVKPAEMVQREMKDEISSPVSSSTKSDEEIVIEKEVKNVRDVIDRIGLEHALEETIIHSLEKLPVLKREDKKETGIISPATDYSTSNSRVEPKTFLDWLRFKAGNEFGKVEEVHANEPAHSDIPDESPEESENVLPGINKDELIDQFIATEPRIVPSKAEFYSPVNQAKKSITDHEDVVSETLARIYFNQGNLQKALSGYKKLSLLHPEKSSYFAPLIQEINNLINKQE
jgi:hypothetical protein